MDTNPQKRRSWTIYRLLLSIAVLSMLLAACGGSTTPQTSSAPVQLKIMDYSPEQATFHKQVADEYKKLHPNVTIQWQSIAQAQYTQDIPLAFQSHQAPDIFYWKSDTNPVLTMQQLLQQGWISTLSPDGKVPQSWMQQWKPGSFQEGINMQGGKVYGFPLNETQVWGPGYMYYSIDLFKQAGLDPASPPKSWDALMSDCQAIKSKTGKYCIASPLKGTDAQRLWFAIAGTSMTDSFFDYKNGRFDLNDPRLIKAYNFIQSLYQANLVIPGVNDKSVSRQQMASGQAAIYFDGSWMPATFTQLGFDTSHYSVAGAPYPVDSPHGAFSMRNSENKYWVSSQTKQARAAWDFIQWMTQPNGFFAQGYVKNGYGTLAYTDNSKYLTDPASKLIFQVANTPGFRVTYPEPLLKCPDLAKSKAYSKAVQNHPNWEWESIVNGLVNHQDFTTLAKQVADGRQQILTQTLQQEQQSGLKVSIDCYTFSYWDYTQNYTQS